MTFRWLMPTGFAVAVVLFALVSPGSVPPPEGVARPDQGPPWGTADLEDLLETGSASVVRATLSPAVGRDLGADVAIVVAPERALFPAEERALDAFLAGGGELYVFLRTGVWNKYLVQYGIAVHGSPLLPTTSMRPAGAVTLPLPPDLGGGRILLPNATALTLAEDPSIRRLYVEEDTVLDLNRNATVDPGDQAGRFAVAATVAVGDGRLVVVASPEAVLGSGLTANGPRLRALVQGARGAEVFLLDGGTHAMGSRDWVRAPAQAAFSQAHGSIMTLVILVLATAAFVLRLPPRPRDPHRHQSILDDATDVTREVTTRGTR